jgi:hypothetical protein
MICSQLLKSDFGLTANTCLGRYDDLFLLKRGMMEWMNSMHSWSSYVD